MARVTGIGGIFFKSRGNRAALVEWYRKHLGVRLESFGGAIFRWPDDPADDKGVTVWHVADATSKWFQPSDAPFMINYRVDDLDRLLDDYARRESRSSAGRRRTRTANSCGFSIRTETRWSCGSQ